MDVAELFITAIRAREEKAKEVIISMTSDNFFKFAEAIYDGSFTECNPMAFFKDIKVQIQIKGVIDEKV
ncbi:hypothetical protein [Hydrogenimonas thermophila]|uniref:Uncharacterized protein n=1 Tax=Hydrogenimonas thermophila TaxID=223786 RepID=A0A1I5LIQ0_9BACT|nr:hypothetical protein [Hydrogenimonas thermophila]SFO97052.1 hypothetical protein SAMN05216234_10345 [Hydrogenimonas thermophila]